MIHYVEANLFTSPAQTLVNTVNTVGVMGKGVAKAFKSVYPDMFEEYKSLCERGEFTVAKLLLYRTHHKWVLNFPTKRHWRQPSRLDDIDNGLETFRQTYAEQGISSVAFLQLGCGNGGLDWETQVRPLMERRLAALPIDVFVHIASRGASEKPDIDEGRVDLWLQGDPQPLAYRAFRQDLVAAIGGGQVARLEANGALGAMDVDPDIEVNTDGLFALWRRLRSFGYLVPDDVTAMLAMPAVPVFDLLTALPYVSRARVARVSSDIGYDVGSTRAMLDAPEAQGVRIVLPLVAERPQEPFPPVGEDDAPWSANRTTSQLALFSTS